MSYLYYSYVLIVTVTSRHQISVAVERSRSGIGCVVESCRKSSNFSCFDISPELMQIIVGDLLPTTTSCNGSFR